ncbi:MAG: hypothetical protein A3D92_19630 [Bacteroidetes bacterium RIFCSPHIGHO2_02_FULL_44_7]|nr:MAG: hypothetical protein A3D92_19630 [Bacteroidetes bacterium RIFCSPHIGHO2_02_FULL_44_7]
MNIIITIPAYNEEKTLPAVLTELKQVMNATSYRYRILILDDGSKDRTAEVARSYGALVVSHRHKGLAETFKAEMRECLKLNADVIVHTDADGQYHPRHIPELIEKIQQGYDLVLGSRFRGRIEQMPLMKRWGNIAFSHAISSLTEVKITDSTTGFRAFTAEVAREINYINTFTYTQEQIIKAAKQGFRITEIPIIARKTRASRLFKSPLQYAIKAWINIFRIYRDYDPLKFFGYVGGTLLGLGFLLGIAILIRILITGGAGGVPRVILSALLMLVGIQVIIFGFLADMLKR